MRCALAAMSLHRRVWEFPIVAITGVGEGAAKQFAEEYNRRPYETVEDIADRGKINKSAIDELRQHGVLDGLPETAQISLFG